MVKTLPVSLVAILLLAPLPAIAADIAGNDGWMTLTEGVARYAIDPAFVDQALDAGGELNCVRMKPNGKNGYQTLNGWFVNGDTTHIVTNGHFMYSKNESGISDARYTDFSDCYLALNRDVLATTEADYPILKIDPDVANYRFADANPAGLDKGKDRGLIPLLQPSPDAQISPMTVESWRAEQIKVGDEVFMLSSARPFHSKTSKGGFEPMLQRCYVLRVDVSTSGHSNQLRTDCDSHAGTSASLILVRGEAGHLEAVGIATGAKEFNDEPDGRPADPKRNAGISILMDARFFTMPVPGSDVLPFADRTGDLGFAQ